MGELKYSWSSEKGYKEYPGSQVWGGGALRGGTDWEAGLVVMDHSQGISL